MLKDRDCRLPGLRIVVGSLDLLEDIDQGLVKAGGIILGQAGDRGVEQAPAENAELIQVEIARLDQDRLGHMPG